MIRSRLLWVLLVPVLAAAQNLAEFEKRVTEFTLANGMHFIVLERPQAPVVSFHTYVDAGSVDDPGGKTGLAHMFEHMAFKGTDTIGSADPEEERKALKEIERIYDKLQAERNKGFRADAEQVQALEKELAAAIAKANTYVEPNTFPRIIEEHGGVGLNAATGMDYTRYINNLPSNRTELWFLLESERFLRPVYREFYAERDVVREERRMRVESSPQGKLMEMLLVTAFAAHPYRNMPGGWGSDIDNLRVGDAEEFFKTYYVPANMTVGIAGDVRPSEIKRLADTYFSRLPAASHPPLVHTAEPEQEGEKRVAVETPAQPFLLIGYKRPDHHHKDDPALEVLAGILASGRTGILYRELVRDRKSALAAAAYPSFPGSKYANLFVFFVAPSLGRTIEENERAYYEIIERLKEEKVDEVTLNRVKTQLRASLIRRLDSNSGMAGQLAEYHANYGNWRKLFTSLGEIDKVSAEDVQRVARAYFVSRARTVAFSVRAQEGSPGGER